ncbi:unnamed protein product, partial [Didymodactylos carnosus]
MQQGGQSLVDRLLAAKNTIAGQALAKTVCKATTEEIMGPKRKHLDFLLQATNEMNVSIPQLADLLIERTQNSSWVVSFKSLVTIHHLMCFGNERFEAYMASHNHRLQPAVYLDRMGMPGLDMSSYIRRYASYLNAKRESYKLMGYDFCKVKRGKEDGVLRTMPTEKLLKALPILQCQLDSLLEFDVTPNELTNGVINSCFFLLIKDLIRLFAAFNDGMINLLEKYFDMNKKQCREALDIYKKFLDRTDKVSNFLKVAETSGMERSEIPDLSRAPSSLLEALENHLSHLEGKKITSSSSISRQQTELDLKNFSRDFIFNDNDDPQKVLEEEAKALAQFNKNKEHSLSSSPPNSNGGDFFQQHQSKQQTTNGHHQQQATASSSVTDLFSLASPTYSQPSQTTSLFNSTPSTVPMQQFSFQPFAQQQQPFAQQQQPFAQQQQPFAQQQQPFAQQQQPFSQQQQPFSQQQQPFSVLDAAPASTNFFNDILQPTNVASTTTQVKSNVPLFPTNNVPSATANIKPLNSDLNSSLSQLIDNLDINNRTTVLKKDHQWTASDVKNQQKIGGSNWNSNIMSSYATPPMATSQPGVWNQPTPISTNPFAASVTGPMMGAQSI